MKDKPVVPNQQDDILAVLLKYPDSLSFVFQIPDDGVGIYYMKLGDPKFTPEDTLYVSIIPVMGFSRLESKIWFDNIKLPRGKELKSITNDHLLTLIMNLTDRIKENPKMYNTDTIDIIHSLGLLNEEGKKE